jgi:polyphosphate glucokinase
MAASAEPSRPAGPLRTLAVDIGGTGIKTMVLNEAGKPLTERTRAETPHPATPKAVIGVIAGLAREQGEFDRASVGFPGVVHRGVVRTAPNLDPKWIGVDLAKALFRAFGKPTRVCNDADIQGYGAIKGRGVELVITLGTGVGSSLFVDGNLIHLELAHHPAWKGRTYEEELGLQALKKVGKKKWNRRLDRAIGSLAHLFLYDTLYLGGGNASRITIDLPRNVRIVPNVAGLLGGIALWQAKENSR